MTDHPDIDELFADDDEPGPDEPSADETTADGATEAVDDDDEDWTSAFDGPDQPDQPDDVVSTPLDPAELDLDDVLADADVDLDDEPIADDEAADDAAADDAVDDDDADDLLSLADEAAARYEPAEPAEPAESAPDATADAAPAAAPVASATRPSGATGRPTVGAPAPPAASAGDDGLLLQFPSQDFPPPPVFRLRVPDDWLAVPVPDALVAVRRPTEVAGFHPNVLVRCRRVVAASEPGAELRVLAALDQVPDGMELLGDDAKTDGPTPARWVQVRFPGPDGLVLQARHLLVYVPATTNVANVLSVVGTWPDQGDDEVAAEVQRVVGSLRLFLPAGATPAS